MIISFRKTGVFCFHDWTISFTPILVLVIPIITTFMFWNSNSIPAFCCTFRLLINNLAIIALKLFALLITSFCRITFFILSRYFVSTHIFKLTNTLIPLIDTFPQIFYSTVKTTVILCVIIVLAFVLNYDLVSTFCLANWWKARS